MNVGMRVDLYSASLEDSRVVYALLRMTATSTEVASSRYVDAPIPGGTPYRQGAVVAPVRRPVNMVLVIDRSSSMRGPRLAQAVLAVRRVVERLDERDRLG